MLWTPGRPTSCGRGRFEGEFAHDSALTNIENLLIYAEQQPTPDEVMRALHSHHRAIKQRRAEQRQTQQTLDRGHTSK